jgi:hypothetical protein
MDETMDHLAKLEANEKNLEKVEISNISEFNKRFIILGEDPRAVLRQFKTNKIKKLLQVKDRFEMYADSDLFRIKMDFSIYNDVKDADKIRRASALARKIYRILKY